jgi:hypothetical protein
LRHELEVDAVVSTATAELHDAGRPFSLSLSKSPSEPHWTYEVVVDLREVEDPVDVHWEIHDTIADALVMRATFRNVLLINR